MKDEKLPYEERPEGTKDYAQRISLEYVRSRDSLLARRKRLTWIAVGAALAVVVPFLFGTGSAKKVFSNAPLSRSHSVFESGCNQCHVAAFSSVPDKACERCHAGPDHPAKSFDTGTMIDKPRCAECHVEHRGTVILTEVKDAYCTGCHSDLKTRGRDVKIAAVNVTAFKPDKHPDFSAALRTDTRPLKLNHSKHLHPLAGGTTTNVKLPMKCEECHVTDVNSAKGDFVALNFDKHCRNCHERELGFDVRGLLGAKSLPAPHTRDPQTIHQHIERAYRDLVAVQPDIYKRDLGRGFEPSMTMEAWLTKVVFESESFLFDRKCIYCHEYQSRNGVYPVVAKVNPIVGRYVPGTPAAGEPWFLRGEFSHRSHRALECQSCHKQSMDSTKTSDVLIPKLASCTGCHGDSGTPIDNCSQCHLYHNKSKEKQIRRPAERLTPN
jgi:predicted CXXCH cytochrome family protein